MQENPPIQITEDSLDRLGVRVVENTDALRGVQTRLNKVQTRSQRTLKLLVAIVLLIGGVLKVNYDGIVDRCDSGNELRSQIDEKFQGLGDAAAAAGFGSSPEEQEILVEIEQDLTPRDCEGINWLGR